MVVCCALDDESKRLMETTLRHDSVVTENDVDSSSFDCLDRTLASDSRSVDDAKWVMVDCLTFESASYSENLFV